MKFLRRRSLAFLALPLSLSTTLARGAAEPAAKRVLTVTVDASASPDLTEEGEKLKAAAIAEYPRLCEELDGPNFKPITHLTIKFADIGPPAYNTGDTITCQIKWFHDHPDDIGCIVHELTHSIQHYTLNQPPGWLTEGIADWTRWFVYEPVEKRPHPDPEIAHYNDSYRTTAAFLDWAQHKYNKDLVQKLNGASREMHYAPAIWKDLTGKSLPELGDEWEHEIFKGVKPAVTIDVDTSGAPKLADFAAKAQFAGERYYGRIAKMLAEDGFTAPEKVTLTIKPGDGVAATSGDHIECNADYYASHPDDVGSIIHELVHVAQHYTKGGEPGWLVEGIADYVRWFTWEPQNKRPHADPATAKYDGSYQTSGEFLAWAQAKYDRQLVKKLNVALRDGTYSDDLWKQLSGGKTVQELGDEWVKTLKAQPQRGGGRRRRGN